MSQNNGHTQATSLTASQIGTRVWSYAGVLKDDGLSYMAYVEQLTFLLFLKMADELTKPPYSQKTRIPKGKDGKAYDWPSLVAKDGAELYQHYRDVLEFLSTQPGLLGTIFKEAECKIKDPAKLRRLIVDLIDRETWLSLDLDVKGVIYEELLIRVTIEQSGHLGQYRAMLEQALAGARVQRGVVAQRIVERVMPADLVVLVRRGDAEGLVQRANLNDEQARKVVDALKNTEALYALETAELADRPRIELKDGEGYKDSVALSTGQKCTIILPILLLDSDTPLLVDQPEDNLDNRFVCESVVKGIRKVKAARQLVFVTHNPNIPVLADAERVFVLESDGVHARKATEGDVDECRDAIVNLLEGGEQAFKRRQERYAY